jgi:glycosyltransferase involved in cell wall biosynthesis
MGGVRGRDGVLLFSDKVHYHPRVARIAIDVQTLQTPERNRGIGRFVRGQIEAIRDLSSDHEYILLGSRAYPEPEKIAPEWKYYALPLEAGSPVNHEVAGQAISEWLGSNRVDCYYATSPLMPDIVIPKAERDVPCVAMVHDLIPLLFERKAFAPHDATYRNDYYHRLGFISSSARILTYSESNRRDLFEQLSIPGDRVDSIGAGLDPRFQRVADPAILEETKRRFGIRGRLILSVTGYNFRKNILGTIESFALLPADLRRELSLLLACSLSPDERTEVEKIIFQLGVSGQVILAGHVGEELPALYSLADVFFFPTLYEGFGFPALEAMACGTPVVVSDTSSLPEVVADAGLLVDPTNPRAGAQAIERLFRDADLGRDMSVRGIERAKEFSWRKTAERTLQAINAALDSDYVTISGERRKKTPLACFSPWPPSRSGIADYSHRLTGALSRYCDPICCTDGTESIQIDFASRPAQDFHGETKALYHVGNSRQNEFVFKAALQYPGVIVLHDWSIHGMVYHSTVKQGDADAYMHLMKTTYGERGEAHAGEVLAGRTTIDFLAFPLSEGLIRRSLGVVVHSSWMFERAISVAGHPPVRMIRHGADVFDGPAVAPEERTSFGIPPGAFTVLSFGRITRHKRIDILLRTFKAFAERYPDSALVIAGETDAEAEDYIRPLFERAGLGKNLLVIGHTPSDRVAPLIRSSDVCVNLRFPTMGETSGSVVRALGLGRPVIATDAGAFRELPDDCVWKIPVDVKEEDLLYAYLERLYLDTDLRNQMGGNALSWVRKNCLWEKTAREYMEFIDFCYSRGSNPGRNPNEDTSHL